MAGCQQQGCARPLEELQAHAHAQPQPRRRLLLQRPFGCQLPGAGQRLHSGATVCAARLVQAAMNALRPCRSCIAGPGAGMHACCPCTHLLCRTLWRRQLEPEQQDRPCILARCCHDELPGGLSAARLRAGRCRCCGRSWLQVHCRPAKGVLARHEACQGLPAGTGGLEHAPHDTRPGSRTAGPAWHLECTFPAGPPRSGATASGVPPCPGCVQHPVSGAAACGTCSRARVAADLSSAESPQTAKDSTPEDLSYSLQASSHSAGRPAGACTPACWRTHCVVPRGRRCVVSQAVSTPSASLAEGASRSAGATLHCSQAALPGLPAAACGRRAGAPCVQQGQRWVEAHSLHFSLAAQDAGGRWRGLHAGIRQAPGWPSV